MTIEGLGAIDPVGQDPRVRKSEEVAQPKPSDEVDFSSESRLKGEFQIAKEQVRNLSDVRADIVAAAKGKINDSTYLNDPDVLDTIADRISDLFLG